MKTTSTIIIAALALVTTALRAAAADLPPGAIRYICYAVTDLRKEAKVAFTNDPRLADVVLSISPISSTADRTVCITEMSSLADITICVPTVGIGKPDRIINLVDDPKQADVVVCITDRPFADALSIHFTSMSSIADVTVCFTEMSSLADVSVVYRKVEGTGK